MALFGRSLKAASEDGALASDGESRSEASSRRTIGQLLRTTRLSSGGDLERIAATLRIRASYLAAIEEARYDRLPGAVYVLGFIRAYAVHLGLDGEEAVRQLKLEMAGLEGPRDLTFPMPLAERSIPGGTMLLAALILAVCGYGLWYYVSTGNRERPERVSPVPADITATLKSPPAPRGSATPALVSPVSSTAAAAAPSDTASAAPAASGLPASPADGSATVAPSSPVLTASASAAGPGGAPSGAAAAGAPIPATIPTPVPSVAAPAPAVTTAALPPSAGSAPVEPAATPGPPAAPSPVAAAPASVSAPAATQVAAPPADAAATAAGASAAAAASGAGAAVPAVPPAPTEPRVYGAPADVPVRIVIHATKDSWIQIRDRDDEVRVQRTLHAGDSVRVPDEPGLVMRTGNALGLSIDVDGKPVRPLRGTVRSLGLDPQELAGTVKKTAASQAN